MARAKRGFKARRRKNRIFKLAKGFNISRRRKTRQTYQTVHRALHYSYIGRRLLKRDMRRLWIQRISAGARTLGTSYSKLMGGLKKNGIDVNRKMLADIAARDFDGFKAIAQTAK